MTLSDYYTLAPSQLELKIVGYSLDEKESPVIQNSRIINLLWLFFEKFGLLVLSAVSFFTFAFFLSPYELGVATIVVVCCELVSVFYNAVLEDPLVRRRCEKSSDLASIFWFGSLLALITMIVVVLVAYVLAREYWQLLAFSSLAVLFSVQARPFIAYCRVKRQFKSLAIRTMWGKLIATVVAILAAVLGAGEWVLVIQLTTMNLVSLCVLMKQSKQSMLRTPNIQSFISIFREGLPIGLKKTLSSLFSRSLVILMSVFMSPTIVGYYSFARRLVELPQMSLKTSFHTYSFPVFVNRQAKPNVLSHLFTELSILSSAVLVPTFALMGIIGSHFIVDVFGEKWGDAVPFFIFFAILASVQTVDSFTVPLQDSLGKAKLGLKTELVKVLALLASSEYLITQFGISGIFLIVVLDTILGMAIRMNAIQRILPVHLLVFLRTLATIIFVTYCIMTPTYLLTYEKDLNSLQLLSVGIVAMACVLLVLSACLKGWRGRLDHILNAEH